MDGHRALRDVLALAALAYAITAHAQAPGWPAFEVASIRENTSASDNASVRAQPGGRFSVTNNSLRNIIRNAYNVQTYQIIGGPDWINTIRWDITAKAPDDAPPQQLLLLMVRTLLSDRLKLVIRDQRREVPIYALVLARPDGRLGMQRRASNVDCPALFAAPRAREKRRRQRPTVVPRVERARRAAA